MLERERQKLACKKQSSTGKRKHGAEIANKKRSATERLENTNKKTRALLDDDVSIINIGVPKKIYIEWLVELLGGFQICLTTGGKLI